LALVLATLAALLQSAASPQAALAAAAAAVGVLVLTPAANR